MLDDPTTFSLVDVREAAEFDEWAIPHAVNIPLTELADRTAELPVRPIVVVCASGDRATRGCELLAEAGFDARILAGGMSAWADVYDDVALEIAGATVVQLRRRGKGCLSYVIGAGGAAVVIDPPLAIEHPLAIARARGWKIVGVIDTHLHADHLSGARLLAESTAARHYLDAEDPYRFEATSVADGDRIMLGDLAALDIELLETPGHTSGSITVSLAGVALFTGDCLFVESVGRPDLAERAEEFAHALYSSLTQRIFPKGNDVLILPAHYGPGVDLRTGQLLGASLGELRSSIPALSLDEDDFVAWAAGQATPRPPNYARIVDINRGAVSLEPGAAVELEAGPNRCAVAAPPTS